MGSKHAGRRIDHLVIPVHQEKDGNFTDDCDWRKKRSLLTLVDHYMIHLMVTHDIKNPSASC
jgi:hypothetical protein